MSNAFRPHTAALLGSRSGHRVPSARPPRGPRLAAPRWYLEWKVWRVGHDIARLEQHLAGEFATLDTAPWIDDIGALSAERGRLLERLASHR